MKTKEQLNADTLFAFQMALEGHKQFEFLHAGIWSRTEDVHSGLPHRIYHDIPEGWTRHDGEDWKGDKDAVIEEIMYCDGTKGEITNISILRQGNPNNFTAENPKYRIYAYKLAAKSPAIPEGFIPWDGGECPVAPDTKIEVVLRYWKLGRRETIPHPQDLIWRHIPCDTDIIAYRVLEKKVIPWEFNTRPKEPTFVYRKGYITDSMIVAWGDDVVVIATKHGLINVTYDELLSDWLRSGGSVCGKEVEQ